MSGFTHNYSLLLFLPPLLFPSVTTLCAMGNQLQLAISDGRILVLNTQGSQLVSPVELRAHVKSIHTLLPLSCRTLPRQWLPSILGRSNVMDYYQDLLAEEDICDINATMVGWQARLLVSIGVGFQGVAGRLVEPLMSPKDREENFILLWAV